MVLLRHARNHRSCAADAKYKGGEQDPELSPQNGGEPADRHGQRLQAAGAISHCQGGIAAVGCLGMGLALLAHHATIQIR